MANKEVSLYKRVYTAKGRRYCPVVLTSNGRVKPDYVLVDGVPERHPEGIYYISWYEGKQLKRLAVGTDALSAGNRRLAKEAELNAKNLGIEVVTEQGTNGHRPLAEAAAEFLEETKLGKKRKTLEAYTVSLQYFQESCTKQFLEEVERKDLLKFTAYLRVEKELAPRTCWNKFNNVMSFLKTNGIRGLVKKQDWPKFTEEEPEIYEKEELDTLFAVCDEDERMWFRFFLMTGMREQEVMFMYWSDVNLRQSTVQVSHKSERGWSPKAYKEREIPIPDELVHDLRAWRAKANRSDMLFPTSSGGVKLDFLDRLKACAERAKLDKENFWLHKFRATFATWNLWDGVDLRTVQSWLGHSDLESTMRYLKPARNKAVRQKANSVWKGRIN